MVTASLRWDRRFERRSAQFAQIVEAAEQATAAKPAPFPTGGAKELVSSTPPCSPRGQKTGDVTSIGDPLNTRRHKVRRRPDQTVQQRLKVEGKKLRTARTENLHWMTPHILSDAQNMYRMHERCSRSFCRSER
ncbi:hypothetical protein [Bradyrhizobium sp. ORS 285]|uniref:hypothetical protein n=1 Tax=Bradyrhizobium sp. ORS 285 TaxID=115808 RepID=UPI001111E7B7|nr:hypothetical protein [Bradyrhizobium sp. ORS 285]